MIVARGASRFAFERAAAHAPLGWIRDAGGLRAVTPPARRWTRYLALLLGFLEPLPLTVILPEHVERLNRRIAAGVLMTFTQPFLSVAQLAREITMVVHALSHYHLDEALAREHERQLRDPRLIAASRVDEFKPPR